MGGTNRKVSPTSDEMSPEAFELLLLGSFEPFVHINRLTASARFNSKSFQKLPSGLSAGNLHLAPIAWIKHAKYFTLTRVVSQ